MELPRLEPIWQRYRDQGLVVAAVEANRDREHAEAFLADNPLTYHLLENGEGDAEVVRRVFGVRAFPTTLLADRQGRVLFYHLGFEPGDEERLEQEVRQLLDLPPAG